MCDYAKQHVDQLTYYLKTYHPKEYYVAFSRGCGVSIQYIGLEGCPAMYMNLCCLTPFFNDRLSFLYDNLFAEISVHETTINGAYCFAQSFEYLVYICLLTNISRIVTLVCWIWGR